MKGDENVVDKILENKFFDAYEFTPVSETDLMFMRSVTLLTGLSLEINKINVISIGFLRVLESAISDKLAKKVMKLSDKLTTNSINVIKSMMKHSLWFEVNILLASLNHLLELLKVVAEDFENNPTVFLVIEYTYNIILSIIKSVIYFVRGFDVEQLKNQFKEDTEKIDEFVNVVLNDLWNINKYHKFEDKLSLMLTILGFIFTISDNIYNGINDSIEYEIRKRGGVPEYENPGD